MRFWNVYNLDDTKNQKQDIPTPLYSLGGTFVNIYQYYFCRAQDIQTLLFWLKESLGSNASRRGVEPRHLGQVVVWHLGRHDACFFFFWMSRGWMGCLPLEGGEQNCCVMKTCDEALCLLHGGASKLQNHNSCDPQIAHSVSETMPYHAISNPSLAQERLPQDSCGWAGLHALRCVSPLVFEKKKTKWKSSNFPSGMCLGLSQNEALQNG